MALDQLTDQEKEALAIGERLEQQEQERDKNIYEEARATEAEGTLYAGKYRSAEALEKAYLELQKKLGSKATESDTDEPTEDTTEEPTEETAEPTEEPPASPDKGDQEAAPDPESKPELSQRDALDIVDSVGGKDAYDAMIAWGSENLPESDQEAYNQILATGNVAAIKLATQGIAAQYRAKADVQGNLVKGRTGSSEPGAKPFRSRAEVNQAMSDYRYDSDPAYRNDVMARLAASPDDLL